VQPPIPPREADDFVIVHTDVRFTLLDRLRLLVRGRMRLETTTEVWCEKLEDGRPYVATRPHTTIPTRVHVTPVLPPRTRPALVAASPDAAR
jgi:hypothetical protein